MGWMTKELWFNSRQLILSLLQIGSGVHSASYTLENGASNADIKTDVAILSLRNMSSWRGS
jgi:hypothetical protein